MSRAIRLSLALALAGMALSTAAAATPAQTTPAATQPNAAAPTPAAAPAPAVASAPATAHAPADTAAAERQVIAYYFHTTARCASCRQIKAYSHAAIEAAFPEELADGRLVWRMVNVDEEGNEHFMEDYELFTKSLVLVEQVQGKQVRWKNLPKIWELLQNKERFFAYVQGEVRAYLAVQP